MTGPLVRIILDQRAIVDVFAQIGRRMGGKPALMKDVGGIMLDEVEENFAQQGRPRWAQVQSVSLRRAGYTQPKNTSKYRLAKNRSLGYQILQDTGRLAASITMAFDGTSATVGTNLVYARIHQFGGKTKPHVIRAKNAKALAFGGRFAKSVNHPGSNIPARPFLTISPAGEQKIIRAGEAFLRGVIGG